MREERRLVGRVLRQWQRIVESGRFPRRDEIDPWLQGEDGANCLLIAVGWSVEFSQLVVVGVNLAAALSHTDTLTELLLSRVPRVLSARRGMMVEGSAALRGVNILTALPARSPCSRPEAASGETPVNGWSLAQSSNRIRSGLPFRLVASSR